MQKINPHLWFDKSAIEAAEFYTSVFPDSKITHKSKIENTPSGDCDIVSFDISGFRFQAISAGPYFKINQSISFMVNFDPGKDVDAKTKIDEIWNKLADGGKIMMPIDKYPFSERYGWVEDKFGVSWQLILTNPAGEPRPFIVPAFTFVGDVYGKAEEATNFYMSVFKDSKRGIFEKYPAGMEPSVEGTVMFTDFNLLGTWFAAMDGAGKHEFKFNEAVSIVVNCENQEEVDYYWEKLSAVPKAEQCGWLCDKFGVSWQIIPTAMNKMMSTGTKEQIARVTQAFLQMKKFDIAKLQQAFDGE